MFLFSRMHTGPMPRLEGARQEAWASPQVSETGTSPTWDSNLSRSFTCLHGLLPPSWPLATFPLPPFIFLSLLPSSVLQLTGSL